jgi:hypothetical protein
MSRRAGRRSILAIFGRSAIANSLRPSVVVAAVLAFVLVTLLIGGCSPTGLPTDSPTPDGADVTSQLRALETPVLRDVKVASSALTANNPSTAGDALERIGRNGRALLDWLDTHPDFVKANRSTTDCLEETMNDLGEQAASLAPALRSGTATTAQTQKLNADLGEAANCIQTSD